MKEDVIVSGVTMSTDVETRSKFLNGCIMGRGPFVVEASHT